MLLKFHLIWFCYIKYECNLIMLYSIWLNFIMLQLVWVEIDYVATIWLGY
jgi:hypothetical protein